MYYTLKNIFILTLLGHAYSKPLFDDKDSKESKEDKENKDEKKFFKKPRYIPVPYIVPSESTHHEPPPKPWIDYESYGSSSEEYGSHEHPWNNHHGYAKHYHYGPSSHGGPSGHGPSGGGSSGHRPSIHSPSSRGQQWYQPPAIPIPKHHTHTHIVHQLPAPMAPVPPPPPPPPPLVPQVPIVIKQKIKDHDHHKKKPSKNDLALTRRADFSIGLAPGFGGGTIKRHTKQRKKKQHIDIYPSDGRVIPDSTEETHKAQQNKKVKPKKKPQNQFKSIPVPSSLNESNLSDVDVIKRVLETFPSQEIDVKDAINERMPEEPELQCQLPRNQRTNPKSTSNHHKQYALQEPRRNLTRQKSEEKFHKKIAQPSSIETFASKQVDISFKVLGNENTRSKRSTDEYSRKKQEEVLRNFLDQHDLTTGESDSFYPEDVNQEPLFLTDDLQSSYLPSPVVIQPPRKHYKIVFIKPPQKPIQKVNPKEGKTIVYVLMQKPDEEEDIQIPTQKPQLPEKPEVYYIPYNKISKNVKPKKYLEEPNDINPIKEGSDRKNNRKSRNYNLDITEPTYHDQERHTDVQTQNDNNSDEYTNKKHNINENEQNYDDSDEFVTTTEKTATKPNRFNEFELFKSLDKDYHVDLENDNSEKEDYDSFN